jgi:beta-glucosidase
MSSPLKKRKRLTIRRALHVASETVLRQGAKSQEARTHQPESGPRFTSRYWDIASKPLYPFGYGLSYTTFKFASLRLSKTRIKAGYSVEVVVDVTNTGVVPGDAVAQLYIHQRSGSASRPVRQLEGFRRVTSVFDVWVGEDSTADLHAELTIEP